LVFLLCWKKMHLVRSEFNPQKLVKPHVCSWNTVKYHDFCSSKRPQVGVSHIRGTHVFFRGLDFEKVLRREVQVPPIRLELELRRSESGKGMSTLNHGLLGLNMDQI
jgi:hypothetical protein